MEKINRVLECARATRVPARWALLTGGGWLVLTLITLLIKMLVESFTGQQSDNALVFLYEAPLLIPFLGVGCWWMVEQGRLHEAFYSLRHIFVPGRQSAREIASPDVIGPLLEVILAEAGAVGTLEADVLVSPTELLKALMRSLRPEDDVILTHSQRAQLHEIVLPTLGQQFLGNGAKNAVVIQNLRNKLRPAAVNALGVLGDSFSIPLLERFAATTQNAEMRASALHSLEQIRERVRSGPEQLLRAGDVPQRPDTLLRPVVSDGTPQSDPQQLLRAESRREI